MSANHGPLSVPFSNLSISLSSWLTLHARQQSEHLRLGDREGKPDVVALCLAAITSDSPMFLTRCKRGSALSCSTNRFAANRVGVARMQNGFVLACRRRALASWFCASSAPLFQHSSRVSAILRYSHLFKLFKEAHECGCGLKEKATWRGKRCTLCNCAWLLSI